ncbi:hypothetical protein [Streptomyces sp. ODS28]|uniref:hypothetical protein n=1 Tax=Streptomyces sp. ODS28 TaxID=3136688 RepID=UPI0031E65EC1
MPTTWLSRRPAPPPPSRSPPESPRAAARSLVGIPAEHAPLDAGDLVLRGVDLLGIQHGLDHYARTAGLFGAGVLDAAPLVAARFGPDAAADAFALLGAGRKGPPKILLDFR